MPDAVEAPGDKLMLLARTQPVTLAVGDSCSTCAQPPPIASTRSAAPAGRARSTGALPSLPALNSVARSAVFVCAKALYEQHSAKKLAVMKVRVRLEATKRVVAAGVEHHNVHAVSCGFETIDHAAQVNRLACYVGGSF